MLAALLVIGLAFLLGSIPTGVLLSRTLGGRDVRQHGSGNIGAANVVRTSGFKVGALVGLIDILKGVAPILVGRLAGVDHTGLAIVAVVAVLGHDFSVFLRFRGGKGVSTTSLASLTALALLPMFLVMTAQPVPYIAAGMFLFALGVWKHRDNIGRLAAGKESKFRRLKPSNES
jgi:glycerol-3-phosphate acyltransferase PlsY